MSKEYEVRNEQVEGVLRELGRYLKGRMPEGWGFTLLMSSHGEGGATFYVSSIERDGALDSMIEFLRKQGKLPAEGAVPSLTAADLGISPASMPKKYQGETDMPGFTNLPPAIQKLHDAGIVFIRSCVETNARSGSFRVEGLLLDGREVGNWKVSIEKIA